MISRELRYKAVIHYKHFMPSLRKVSRLYGISKTSLHRWVRADPACRKRRTKKDIRASIANEISQCIAQNPFVTALEVSRHVSSTCDARMSRSTAARYIKRCGFSYKKAFRRVDYSHTLPVVQGFCEGYLQSEEIVCIDEAGLYVGDHCKNGYSPVGCRLRLLEQCK